MMRQLVTGLMAVLIGAAVFTIELPEARAQEIQLTGPLAGAPAVRRLRLHRDGRFDIAVAASFTLLDEYRRTIMPTVRANYHFYDWLGVGVFGGPGFQLNAALADELQQKAIGDRDCENNQYSLACKRSKVSLCRGDDCLAKEQLAQISWLVMPQITFVPFRGKISLFSALFMDTDVSFFLGPAVVGLMERAECESNCGSSFGLEHRVTVSPAFGMGFNIYPNDFIGFGTEFRLLPFPWNPSGFDVSGEDDVPDNKIDGNDRAWRFNSMLSVYVSMQLPMDIKISD